MSRHDRKKKIHSMPKVGHTDHEHAHHEHHHKTSEPKKEGTPFVWIGVTAALAILVIAAVLTQGFSKPLMFKWDKADLNTEGKAELEFYVMSKCPYGVEVENSIKPVLDKLGDSVVFKLDFISTDNGDGTFRSLHGDTETKGNIVQLCAAKYNPDKYMDMVVCMNKNTAGIPGNWEQCAAGLDSAKIKTCYEGQEGIDLLKASVKRSEEAQASGSPTIFINGESYRGARDTNSFMKLLCSKIEGHPECESIPACSADADCTAEAAKDGKCENPGEKDAKCVYTDPMKITVTYLVDDRCAQCNPGQINDVTKNIFKGAEFKEVKWDSSEGKQLMERYEIKMLPAFIFDSEMEESVAWTSNARLQTSFQKEEDGKYTLLPAAIGATWDPYAEICDNGKDDDANGQVDCKDPACADSLSCFESVCNNKADEDKDGDVDCDDSDCADSPMCMEFEKPQIDFFVMSYCPYGNQAEEAIAPVYEALKDDAIFKPHYIYYENYRGGGASYCIDAGNKYCSMHGVQEANQNVREQCVAEKYGMEKWFEFSMAMNKKCTSANADTCWEAVAKDLKYDVDWIKTCQKDKATTFAAEDARLMKIFGASGSPAVYINGASYSGQRTPAGYQQALCALLEDSPGCKVALEGEGAVTPTGGCG